MGIKGDSACKLIRICLEYNNCSVNISWVVIIVMALSVLGMIYHVGPRHQKIDCA